MESAAVRSLSSTAKPPSFMAFRPCYGANHHILAQSPQFQQPAAPPEPPLMPLPLPLHFQVASPAPVTASRSAPRGVKKPRHATASPRKPANGASSAPIDLAAPFKKRTAAAERQETEWPAADSLYSVSPPPSSVPMPTSLLLTAAAGRKAPPTVCAVEVAGGAVVVDATATDELRRLLRL